ncbi:MAG: hypothetical protein J6D52_06200 [Clostridia bacterium]|nr:hypothetical protein [Clostridia bacterium]
MKKFLILTLTLVMAFITSCEKNIDNMTPPSVITENQTETKFEKFKSIDGLKARFADFSTMLSENKSNTLYYPEMLIEGYDLLFIEMNSHYVFYYYMPTESINNNADCSFDYETGFIVTLSLDYIQGNRMQILSNQLGIDISDNGTIYDEERDVLIVPIGNLVYDITFPKCYTGERKVNTVFEMKSTVIE